MVKRLYTIAGFAIGLGAVVLQFYLSVTLRMSTGDTLTGALVYFFSFFTILANIALVLVYLSDLLAARWLNWFRSPVTRGTMAALAVLVMVTYHLLLASIWEPQGLFKLCDITLHYVTPVLFVAWWIVFQPHRQLIWRALPIMLVPALVYFVYAMVRGAITGEYPYPFLEANRLGYPMVAINAVYMLIFLAILCAIVIIADKMLAGRSLANA